MVRVVDLQLAHGESGCFTTCTYIVRVVALQLAHGRSVALQLAHTYMYSEGVDGKAVILVLSRYRNFHVVKCGSAICSDYLVEVREAFLRSHVSAPRPPPPPPPISKLPFFLSLLVCRQSSLLTGEGEGGRCGAESYHRKNAWPSKNHLIFADFYLIIRANCRASLYHVKVTVSREDQSHSLTEYRKKAWSSLHRSILSGGGST
jgi:hypothetical protein